MQKRKLTWEDLEKNPQLQLDGLKPGDEIEIPESNELSEEDTGGSAPPPDKPRDD